jgi:hypothetical protein
MGGGGGEIFGYSGVGVVRCDGDRKEPKTGTEVGAQRTQREYTIFQNRLSGPQKMFKGAGN